MTERAILRDLLLPGVVFEANRAGKNLREFDLVQDDTGLSLVRRNNTRVALLANPREIADGTYKDVFGPRLRAAIEGASS